MKNLIIEKPKLSPLSNRIGWLFFTALFWILWAYLWIPLITLILWWFGFHLYDEYFQVNSLNEFAHTRQLLLIYLLVILFLGGSLLTWARIEFMRFHHLHRRVKPLPVEIVELAGFAQIPAEEMTELSSVRRMIVHHDEHGQFLSAEIG